MASLPATGDAVLPPMVLVLRAAFLGHFVKVQGGVPGTAATVVQGSVSDPGEKCCGVWCGNVYAVRGPR